MSTTSPRMSNDNPTKRRVNFGYPLKELNTYNHNNATMPGGDAEKLQWLQDHSETINNLFLAAIAGLARWTLKPDVNFKKGALRFFGGVLLALTVGIVIRKSDWLHSINNFVIAFCAIAGDRIVKVVLDNAPDIGKWMLIKAGMWASGGKLKETEDEEKEQTPETPPANQWKHTNHPPTA